MNPGWVASQGPQARLACANFSLVAAADVQGLLVVGCAERDGGGWGATDPIAGFAPTRVLWRKAAVVDLAVGLSQTGEVPPAPSRL